MATFQNMDPSVRVYFKKHSIPDIYEALISGLLTMRPDEPLEFLAEKIKEMMEKGIYSILWNMCIDPELRLKLKVISETYLHTLLGLDDDQLMTPELCQRAWNFYSCNLKRMCFDAWLKYCEMRKIGREILQRKIAFAKSFYEHKLQKSILNKWNKWVHHRKEEHKKAANRIGKAFDCALQKFILKAWQKQTRFTRKAKKYMEHAEKEPEELVVEVPQPQPAPRERRHSDRRRSVKRSDFEFPTMPIRTGRDLFTKLPEKPLAVVFRFLTLIDLARCAQVSHTWRAMTQMSSLWNYINFSAVKEKIKDNIAGHMLLKWHTNVVHLNLRGCSTLTWFTFKSIGQCKNLQELNVSECQTLNDELMRLVSEGCPALLYLNLSHTDITNGTLRLLSRGFPNLQFLSLAYCRKFTDKGLQYLGCGRGCHKLIYLDISGCLQISVEGFRNIAKSCSRIQYLTINEMPTLTDRCIQALAEKCQKIISVEFNESPHVSDTAFKALAACKLVKMKIEGSNRITERSFRLMSKFWPGMKRICVADCQKIIDAGLKMITPLSKIIVLNLSDCIRISDAGIKSFVEGSSATKIRELVLANCSYISDSAVIKIAQRYPILNNLGCLQTRCSNLTYLNLRYCQAVSDIGIESLTQMPSLAYINISGLDITDQALETLGRLWKIKEITISECRLISDSGIKRFCFDLKKLELVDFSHCPQLSNNSLKHLAFNCHRLTTLCMAGCPKITDSGIQFVAAGCSYLHYLDISGCIYVTDKSLKCLWKGCLQLRIVKMLYCTNIARDTVLKFATRLQKFEYNDDEPPMWFGYKNSGETLTPKKRKKAHHGTSDSTGISPVDSPSGKSLETRRLSIKGSPSSRSLEPRKLSVKRSPSSKSLESQSSLMDPLPEN